MNGLSELHMLSGVVGAVSANQSMTTAFKVTNKTSVDRKIVGYSLRYKAGLESVCIDIQTPSTQNAPFVSGKMSVADTGSSYDNPAVPFKLPSSIFLKKSEDVTLLVQTGAVPVGAGEISITFMTLPV